MSVEPARLKAARLSDKLNGIQRDSKARAITQLVCMQHRLAEDSLNPDTEPRVVAQCACAWQRLENQRLILIGFGPPDKVEAKNGKPKASKNTSNPSTWHDPSPVAIEAVEVKQIAPVVVSEPAKVPTSDAVQPKPDTTSQQ